MKLIAALALTAAVFNAQAQSTTPPAPQRVIALVAAVGDRIEMVRQRQQVGSHMEPFTRKTIQVPTQALNYAVLRGLDSAVAEDDPQARRVLLQWTMPTELADRVEKASGQDRQPLVLDALLTYLRAQPQRKEWDQIELLVPAYFYAPVRGMGTRLSGIGVYIQPLANQSIQLGDLGETDVNISNADGDYKTVNPNTGETAKSSVYVAPFMYFERLTYNARTMELLKRQRFFSNTKFADPQSTALDVGNQMSPEQLLGKLMDTVEQAAYKSIRQSTGEVTVSPIKPLPAASAAGGY